MNRFLSTNTYARLQKYAERIGTGNLNRILEYWMDEHGDFIIDDLEERIQRKTMQARAENAVLFMKSRSGRNGSAQQKPSVRPAAPANPDGNVTALDISREQATSPSPHF